LSIGTGRALPHNKVCELEDFGDPDLRAVIRDVFSHDVEKFGDAFPAGFEDRKCWELGMSVRAFRAYGVLRPDARILGVGAGTEPTIFYLTHHVGEVLATDLYSVPIWGVYSPPQMLSEPERFAPYGFRRDRLTVRNMDGRALQFPRNTFDGVFCSSSIEHFGGFEQIANAAYEMGRVLKPGGLLTISTEYLISGPEGSDGWEDVRLFRRSDLSRYIVQASGLEPGDALSTDVSEQTLASEWELSLYAEDQRRQMEGHGDYPRIGETVWSHYPCLVVHHQGHVFTSVHFALRKTARWPAVDNGWARPRFADRWDPPTRPSRAHRLASSPRATLTSTVRRLADAVRRRGRAR
jgi:SAM-dependent methyltransferase